MIYNIGLISLGCEKNRVDSEIMMAKLKEDGFNILEDVTGCDAVIVNTCGFIESAKRESIEEILRVNKLKDSGKLKALIVTGCLAERYKEEVAKELPEVNAVVGIGANNDISDIVKRAILGEQIESFPDKVGLPLEGNRIQSTPQYFSYLKIAEGCDNKCTYCAIPMIRGKFRSRKIESIIEEAESLVKNGVKELNVIAQDTTRYGEDIYGKLMLPELLKKLCKIDGLEWIRLLYCYPDRITDELLEVIASEDKILKYIDLPLQHCSGKILRSMNRFGNRKSLSRLITKIRNKIPGVTIRTTFIVGFPGETDEDFEELMLFIKEMNFERMGCFTYSIEEGTPAATMKNQIDEDVKLRRQQIVMEEQMYLMSQKAKNLIGKTFNVLHEGFDKNLGLSFGRSEMDAPEVDTNVFYNLNKKEVLPGDFIKVKIIDVIDEDLLGEVV